MSPTWHHKGSIEMCIRYKMKELTKCCLLDGPLSDKNGIHLCIALIKSVIWKLWTFTVSKIEKMSKKTRDWTKITDFASENTWGEKTHTQKKSSPIWEATSAFCSSVLFFARTGNANVLQQKIVNTLVSAVGFPAGTPV